MAQAVEDRDTLTRNHIPSLILIHLASLTHTHSSRTLSNLTLSSHTHTQVAHLVDPPAA